MRLVRYAQLVPIQCDDKVHKIDVVVVDCVAVDCVVAGAQQSEIH